MYRQQEIYRVCTTCCIIFILFFTDCHIVYNFVFFLFKCVFHKHSLKFKKRPGRLRINPDSKLQNVRI